MSTSSPRVSRVVDVVLALAVTTLGLAETWVPFQSRAGDGSLVTTTVVTTVVGLALLIRRTHPLATLLVIMVTFVLGDVVGAVYVLFFGGLVPIGIAVFSVARHGRGRTPWVGAACAAAMLLVVDLVVEELQSPGEIVFHWGVLATVWGFGFGLRRHELRAEASVRRAVEAEVAAAEQAMAAVLAERTRIARELHDIVAHSVSTMVVQAGAAEQVVDEDPELVRRALATIRTTGADALAEMRRVVAMLREDGAGELVPQPGLDGVAGLVATAREEGLAVILDERGTRPALPPGVELTAYRVVQEALTNARRHARATTVRVLVQHLPEALLVEVADDGDGSAATTRSGTARPPVAGEGGGHGLVGMRERVALYGGEVSASRGADGGFVVRATLPVPTAPGSPAPAASPRVPGLVAENLPGAPA